jgi:hypothetical protein
VRTRYYVVRVSRDRGGKLIDVSVSPGSTESKDSARAQVAVRNRDLGTAHTRFYAIRAGSSQGAEAAALRR